jgi:hypothetical protein
MGLLDIFKPKRRGAESAQSKLMAAAKHAVEAGRGFEREQRPHYAALRRIWDGVGDRDRSLFLAAEAGLIPAPPHLAARIGTWRMEMAEIERKEAEAGIVPDSLSAAHSLLLSDPDWPEGIAFLKQELGIRTADDIGLWRWSGRKVAPYTYELQYVYQTPDEHANNGPVTGWAFLVNLKTGTVEAIP